MNVSNAVPGDDANPSTAGQPHDSLLLTETDDRIVVQLNRPAARNAINQTMVDALHHVCHRLEREPKVLILTGGNGIFAAGADIAELRDRGRADALRGINSALFRRVAALPMPTIALIDGPAYGGGAELAYACDFRIGTARTRIGNPEPGLGILAAAGATWRLAQLVGEPLAKEVLLAGRVLTAEEATAARLLNELVDTDTDTDTALLGAGHRLADRIAAQAPLAVQLTKTTFHAPASAHPVIDNLAQAVLFETEQKETRMTAFLNRKAGG